MDRKLGSQFLTGRVPNAHMTSGRHQRQASTVARQRRGRHLATMIGNPANFVRGSDEAACIMPFEAEVLWMGLVAFKQFAGRAEVAGFGELKSQACVTRIEMLANFGLVRFRLLFFVLAALVRDP